MSVGERIFVFKTEEKYIDALWDEEAAYYALYHEARRFARALINRIR